MKLTFWTILLVATAFAVHESSACPQPAWGRTEAANHFPSDVLAGYELEHFLVALVDKCAW